MGYCQEQTDSKFFMAAKDLPYAIQAIKSWVHNKSHIPWVSIPVALAAPNISLLLREFRWAVSFDSSGNVSNLSFIGEKAGEDLELFQQIAPFVKHGSYIEMCGEDSSIWRWKFSAGTVREVYAMHVFDEDDGDVIDVTPIVPALPKG